MIHKEGLLILLINFLTISMTVSQAGAQSECPSPTILYLGSGPAEPCMIQQVDIPVYMNNPCAVGGFEIHIAPSNPVWGWFSPGDLSVVDTTGSRLSDWELFLFVVAGDSAEISVVGIADLPGGRTAVQLPPGDGLIFTIKMTTSIYALSDTNLPVIVSFADISDTSGYVLFNVNFLPGSIDVYPSYCDNNPRGDCNCNGDRNGIDVVYLVNYLKGIGVNTICGGCGGDANNTGSVNGLDVVFLVNYLKGIGPAPVPCN